MITPALLEASGAWRRIGLTTGLLVALVPVLALLVPQFGESRPFAPEPRFVLDIIRSGGVATAASALGLVAGLPLGLSAALYAFPLRRLILAVLMLPLVVPSFLWAIGLSSLRIRMGLGPGGLLSGASGSVLAFGAFTIPLVALVTCLAASGLPRSQVEAARIAGGERVVLRYALGAILPVSIVVALLGGVVTLSDPGPGQILGFNGAAAEILVSFASRYDFAAAARQSAWLGAAVLLGTIPVLLYAGRRLAHAVLVRAPEPVRPIRWSVATWAGPALSMAVIGLTLVAPLVGLALPALERFEWERTLETVGRTAPNTFVYAISAGLVAAGLGLALAVSAGRARSLRVVLLAGLVILFVLPPTVGALGTISLGSVAPPALDPLFRSRFTVGLILALRLVPVPAVLFVRALGQMPPSWALAASIHGVGFWRYGRSVLTPLLLPTFALGVAIVALLATADIGTTLLLQPPGESSLPVSIFTIMANAPEAQVASLCLAYMAIAGFTIGMLGLAGRLWARDPAAFRSRARLR